MKAWTDEEIDLMRLHIGRYFQVEYPERDWERQRAFERALIRAAVDEARREEREVIVALADASTGPTGGWLISPKKFTAAILARGDKEPRDAER